MLIEFDMLIIIYSIIMLFSFNALLWASNPNSSTPKQPKTTYVDQATRERFLNTKKEFDSKKQQSSTNEKKSTPPTSASNPTKTSTIVQPISQPSSVNTNQSNQKVTTPPAPAEVKLQTESAPYLNLISNIAILIDDDACVKSVVKNIEQEYNNLSQQQKNLENTAEQKWGKDNYLAQWKTLQIKKDNITFDNLSKILECSSVYRTGKRAIEIGRKTKNAIVAAPGVAYNAGKYAAKTTAKAAFMTGAVAVGTTVAATALVGQAAIGTAQAGAHVVKKTGEAITDAAQSAIATGINTAGEVYSKGHQVAQATVEAKDTAAQRLAKWFARKMMSKEAYKKAFGDDSESSSSSTSPTK